MKTFILAAFLVILCISLGDSLMCYHCELCVNLPFLNHTTPCSRDQQCVTSKANSDTLIKRGCLDSEKCGTSEVIALSSYYHSCCDTDLCNSGYLPQLSLLAGLAMAGLWLLTLL
ncbi:short neurotoxin 6-like [Rhinatrema bivittatum]|uniref:short neurotoxin 6-like n=1 Tax=Rhinatrema bivittatum TaxID=194408 RepID=UPI00112E2C3F|nr:short neurotoxin 6-like [Rhinatrema bivittatum]